MWKFPWTLLVDVADLAAVAAKLRADVDALQEVPSRNATVQKLSRRSKFQNCRVSKFGMYMKVRKIMNDIFSTKHIVKTVAALQRFSDMSLLCILLWKNTVAVR